MHIMTGIGLDTRHPNKLATKLGTAIGGELRLIEYLEFYGGIVSQGLDRSTRVIHYLNALKHSDNGERFYSRSLLTDPIVSAETLLRWRDWAILHGWQHEPGSANDGRLADLSIVEQHLSEGLGSLGERIYLLFERLDLIKPSIKTITLLNPQTEWPALFQRLFDQLSNAGIQILEETEVRCAHASMTTDLGKIQQALVENKIKSEPLTQDGTVNFFHTSSAQLASTYAARLSNKDSLIIADTHLHCLGTACTALDGGSIGAGSASYFRVPNQLLLLMLQCAWLTPQPEVLLQYLTLPVGKFKKLRSSIAKLFKDEPGYHVSRWQSEIDTYVIEQMTKIPTMNECKLREDIQAWLPISTCSSNQHMPVEQAIVLCEQVASHWMGVSKSNIDEEYSTIVGAAYAAANAAVLALRAWPEVEINQEQLSRLVSMTMEMGQANWHALRMVSAFDVIHNPEVVRLRQDEIKQLIWIDPTLSVQASEPPFSKAELACIPLAPDKARQALTQRMALSRALAPILAATERVTFIAIDEQPDLLKLQINALLDTDRWPSLESALLTSEVTGALCKAVNEFSLPDADRFWDVGQSAYTARNEESYSSLASLALKPHEYVLNYMARFSDGSIHALPVDARLKGNLAHAIVDTWFKENPWTGSQLNSKDITNWLDRRLPDLFQQCALPLLQPGRQVERLEFIRIINHALVTLLDALVAANVVAVKSELAVSRQEKIGLIKSRMDLYCELANGQFAIIDMKWGSYNKCKDELKNGAPLQLATYARIAGSIDQEKLADAAYFIFKNAELLSTHRLVFPTATCISSKQITTLSQTWQIFENTTLWRISQLEKGLVEITYGNVSPDQALMNPENILPVDTMEKVEKNNNRSTYGKSYKFIDPWRNLTRNSQEI